LRLTQIYHCPTTWHNLGIDMNEKLRSPCIANCKLDEFEVCQGCHRTIDEILQWSSADEAKKLKIITRVKLIKIQNSTKPAAH